MALTRNEIKQFREDFKNAVKDLEQQYNLDIKLGNIRFGKFEFYTKLTCTKTTEKAKQTVMETLKNEFRMWAETYGVNPDLFGKSYTQNGKIYTVAGINNRARKYPVLLNCSDGKTYKSDKSMLKFHFRNYESEKKEN